MRSLLVKDGRFTCRLRTRSCWRRSAFSAISSDLLRPRSVRVASGKEVLSGLVQRAKREENASQQPSFSRKRGINTPAIQEASPSREKSVVRAEGRCERRLIVHQASWVCKQEMEILLPLDGLVFERMTQVASTREYRFAPSMPAPQEAAPVCSLLSDYDEYTIASTNRTDYLLDPQRTYRDNIALNRPVIINGYVVGTWKRAIKTKMIGVDVELFTPLQPAETRALQDAIERYSRFMDLPVTASYT
jgi:Winged helix DNA-binding domain